MFTFEDLNRRDDALMMQAGAFTLKRKELVDQLEATAKEIEEIDEVLVRIIGGRDTLADMLAQAKAIQASDPASREPGPATLEQIQAGIEAAAAEDTQPEGDITNAT